MTSRNELHKEALKVIKEYRDEGKPFVLYLRKFDFEVFHGKNETDRYLTDNYLASNLPQGINFISIQDPQKASKDFSILFRQVPSLDLRDIKWETIVDGLIGLADIIISECLMLTQGVRYELNSCVKYNKHHQTVLILPPPNSYLETIDDDELIQKFPRCIWANEFHTNNLLNSFVISDLLDRIKDIAKLSKKERKKIIDYGDRLLRYPITYKGITEGYIKEASMIEIRELFEHSSNDDEDVDWYYVFWNYFRALSILSLQYLSGKGIIKNIVSSMVNCYLKMGELMLKVREENNVIVIEGDIKFASECAISAHTLASKYQMPLFLELAEMLLIKIDQLEKAISKNINSFVFRPIIKPIVTRKGK